MTPEGRLVAQIKAAVVSAGGLVRKCSWEGRIGAPDLLIMIRGHHYWIECKAPGERPRVAQLREIFRMRSVGGCEVFVFDSVDAFRDWLEEVCRG